MGVKDKLKSIIETMTRATAKNMQVATKITQRKQMSMQVMKMVISNLMRRTKTMELNKMAVIEVVPMTPEQQTKDVEAHQIKADADLEADQTRDRQNRRIKLRFTLLVLQEARLQRT